MGKEPTPLFDPLKMAAAACRADAEALRLPYQGATRRAHSDHLICDEGRRPVLQVIEGDRGRKRGP